MPATAIAGAKTAGLAAVTHVRDAAERAWLGRRRNALAELSGADYGPTTLPVPNQEPRDRDDPDQQDCDPEHSAAPRRPVVIRRRDRLAVVIVNLAHFVGPEIPKYSATPKIPIAAITTSGTHRRLCRAAGLKLSSTITSTRRTLGQRHGAPTGSQMRCAPRTGSN